MVQAVGMAPPIKQEDRPSPSSWEDPRVKAGHGASYGRPSSVSAAGYSRLQPSHLELEVLDIRVCAFGAVPQVRRVGFGLFQLPLCDLC
jgi:hypothetical protein